MVCLILAVCSCNGTKQRWHTFVRISGSRHTGQAAEEYGKIRTELEKKGTPIGPMDTLIAGHAKSRGLILVTNTTREFKRVVGLTVEDWTQE